MTSSSRPAISAGSPFPAKDKDGEKYLDKIKAAFRRAGYLIVLETLIASNFGVPQHRKRVIIISREGNGPPNICKAQKIKARRDIHSAI